jgi:hypothetical protein
MFSRNIKLNLFALIIGGMLAFNLQSCKKDDDMKKDDEQELITSLILNLSENGNNSSFAWRDIDGAGGNPPVIDTIRLLANTTYNLSLEVLDESKNPVEEITEEINEEDEEHLFVFEDNAGLLTITTVDMDSNGDPVGLENTLQTVNRGTGKLKISLKHESDKSNPENTGETDIEVEMDYVVE